MFLHWPKLAEPRAKNTKISPDFHSSVDYLPSIGKGFKVGSTAALLWSDLCYSRLSVGTFTMNTTFVWIPMFVNCGKIFYNIWYIINNWDNIVQTNLTNLVLSSVRLAISCNEKSSEVVKSLQRSLEALIVHKKSSVVLFRSCPLVTLAWLWPNGKCLNIWFRIRIIITMMDVLI